MDNLKKRLGNRIKTLRKAKNITQEKLAEIINMDITSLSKIETGRNYPQPETIEKISIALNVKINELFTFEELSTKQEYFESIIKNLEFIKNNEEKLKIMYLISSAFL
ncbi:helix-turn-helix transcriptional regulator [bacterium]|nr:helix-turn-helix transcriptional regulator [bacterium]